jgi:hypothetical protein
MLYEQAAQVTYRYRELAIQLSREPGAGPQGPFRAHALDADGRAFDAMFRNPLRPGELSAAVASIPAASKGLQRSVPDQSLDPVRELGSRLFDALFRGALGRLLVGALASGGDGVRIMLKADDDAAAALPWEYLYDGRDFLALSTRSPIVRRAFTTGAPPALPPLPSQLRMLVVAANVTGTMNVDEELGRIRAADNAGVLDLDVLEDATPRGVEARLRAAPYDVVHYIGTGIEEVERAAFSQTLALVGDRADGDEKWPAHTLLDAPQLDRLFAWQEGLRLLVLNGCRTDWLAGELARRVPATIGHRGDVSEDAALAFTEGLYSALLNGVPLEASVTGARLTMESRDPGGREWSAPVFYLQAADGTFLPSPAELSGSSAVVPFEPAAPTDDGDDAPDQSDPLALLLNIQQSNLDVLTEQSARFGDSAPPYLSEQIESAKHEIQRLQAELASSS